MKSTLLAFSIALALSSCATAPDAHIDRSASNRAQPPTEEIESEYVVTISGINAPQCEKLQPQDTGLSHKVAAYAKSEFEVPPRPRTRPGPRFPIGMKQRGMEGTVLLQVVVGPDGQVKEAVPIRTSNEDFAEAAVSAVSRWIYVPGTRFQKKENCLLVVPISFVIERDPERVRQMNQEVRRILGNANKN